MRFLFALLLCVAVLSATFSARPAYAENTDVLAGAERLIVVYGETTDITLHALEKKNGKWREAFRTKGFSGKGGIGESKREGDGKTPAGVFAMRRAFGIKDNPGAVLPYTKVTEQDYWVDDAASALYNTWVRGKNAGRDWKSAEHLISEKIAYNYAVVIEYNTDPIVKGAGSAIFLHCSKGRPTAGCVSVPEEYMVRLLHFIQPGDKIIIARTLKETRIPIVAD